MYLKLFKTSYPSFEEGRLGTSLARSLGYCCDLHHIFATTIVLGLRKGTQAFRASQDKSPRSLIVSLAFLLGSVRFHMQPSGKKKRKDWTRARRDIHFPTEWPWSTVCRRLAATLSEN